jgi:AraC-like DNA-binding protein
MDTTGLSQSFDGLGAGLPPVSLAWQLPVALVALPAPVPAPVPVPAPALRNALRPDTQGKKPVRARPGAPQPAPRNMHFLHENWAYTARHGTSTGAGRGSQKANLLRNPRTNSLESPEISRLPSDGEGALPAAAAATAAPAKPLETQSWRFDTEPLPERDRLAFVRDFWGRAVQKLDMVPLTETPYHAKGFVRVLPGLRIADCITDPLRIERTKALMDDGSEDAMLLLRSGNALVSQLGREVPLQAGEAIIVSSAEVRTTSFLTVTETLTLPLSRQAMAPLVRNLEDAFMRPVRNAAALRMLTGYVDMFEVGGVDNGTLPPPELQRMVVAHIQDLMSLVIGATREAAEVAHGRGVRAARLAAIRADVLANLTQVRLSPKLMAQRHGVSERYVYALFEESGISFHTFVAEERLKRALAMLRDPGCDELKISDIALETGFGDLSTFNRAFRRRFGDTPRGIRRAGADEAVGSAPTIVPAAAAE